MKRTIFLSLALIGTLAIFAQRPDGPPQRQNARPGMGQRPGAVFKDLNLTDEQQQKMKTLYQDFRQQMKALQENENITVKQQRDQLFNLTREHKKKVDAILTPEQREKMKSSREANITRIKEMQNNRFEKMASELKLTEDQKTKLKQGLEKNREAMMALMQNDKLDRNSFETQRKTLMEQHRKDMEQILTKEQAEQWKKMQENRPMKARPGFGPGPGRGWGQGRPPAVI